MRKSILSFIVCIMFIPFVVNAKEYCKVVSGNGKDIGSEIACGTEHFYIISANDEKIKMLAKYNLNVGITIYKEKIEKEDGDTRTDQQYCQDLASSKNGWVKSDGFYNEPGYCFYAKDIWSSKYVGDTFSSPEEAEARCKTYSDEEFICYSQGVAYNTWACNCKDRSYGVQNKEAKSAHWDDELNYLYPQVGDNYLGNGYNNASLDARELDQTIEYTDTRYKDFKVSASDNINPKLSYYKDTLNRYGYEIDSIDLLSLSEIDDIVEYSSNNRLPLKEWGDEVANGGSSARDVVFGHFKELIPKEYSWLYSTTYWNKTIFARYSFPPTYSGWYYVFVAEQGKICGAGFEMCAPQTTLGCGIRPVITILKNELQYSIKTKTDGKGTIDVVENSLGGEEIQFKVSSNKGYKLGSIIIKTDTGEEVEFSEGEITKNEDGTISIDKNKFTMPFSNVTIEAKHVSTSILKNPETGNIIWMIIMTIITSSVFGTIIYKRKRI